MPASTCCPAAGSSSGWCRLDEGRIRDIRTEPLAERGKVTDEYIPAFRELWTSDNPTFKGKYCSFSDILFLPKPVQKPAIPIWIGGHSKHAIRRAAHLGDGWHPIGGVPTIPLEPEDIVKDMSVLREYATKAGRDPKNIRVALKGSLFDHEKKIEAG